MRLRDPEVAGISNTLFDMYKRIQVLINNCIIEESIFKSCFDAICELFAIYKIPFNRDKYETRAPNISNRDIEKVLGKLIKKLKIKPLSDSYKRPNRNKYLENRIFTELLFNLRKVFDNRDIGILHLISQDDAYKRLVDKIEQQTKNVSLMNLNSAINDYDMSSKLYNNLLLLMTYAKPLASEKELKPSKYTKHVYQYLQIKELVDSDMRKKMGNVNRYIEHYLAGKSDE